MSATLLILGASTAFSQTPSDGGPDPSKVRVRVGPLWMNPTIAVTNAGVDTNVFNEADQDHPKRDYTVTITPQTDLWMRMGRTWVIGQVKEDIVWFRTYASERSANDSYMAGWRVPLNRLTLGTSATWLSSRDRPGFEIDARSRRREKAYNGTVEVRALSKTFFGVRGQRQQVDFDKDAVFLGNNLHFELNRVVTTTGVTIRHQLTPLTSLTAEANREQDRFEFSSLRDSNSTGFSGSIAFDPAALIKGTARFGYRDFRPLSGTLPGYKGSTALVDLSYNLLGTTKLALQGIRDVEYSYDIDQPYYVRTGGTGSIAQQIFGPLDVVARIGAQQLAYRDRAGAIAAVSNRIDQVHTYGFGVGYHLGKETRLGFDIDHQKRTSGVASRQYHGLRYGTSVTYGS